MILRRGEGENISERALAPECESVCTVADRNSNRTSYQPGAYSNPQNELYVVYTRARTVSRSSKPSQTPKSAYAYASKSGFRPGRKSIHDVPIYNGLLEEDICDGIRLVFFRGVGSFNSVVVGEMGRV